MNKAQGTIVSAISGYYDVEIENKVVRTRARGVFRDRKQKPLVGDRVVVQLDDQGMNWTSCSSQCIKSIISHFSG